MSAAEAVQFPVPLLQTELTKAPSYRGEVTLLGRNVS